MRRHGIQRRRGSTGQIPHLVTERFDEFSVQKSEPGAPYGPSKAALESATVIWARDLVGTGVTVNALAPGGPANTRMIPKSEVGDRSTLIQPEVMMAPIVWLMSARSDGVSGRRIIAKEWDADRLQRETSEKIRTPSRMVRSLFVTRFG